MTRKMEVEYLRPVLAAALFASKAASSEPKRRKYWAEAAILSAEGTVLAQATGLFIEVRKS